MKPYYSHAGIEIWLGDCREVLRDLEFDAICADPPYGVGKDYGELCDDTLKTFQWSVSLVAARGVPSSVFVPANRIYDLPVRPQWTAIWAKTYGASGLIAYPIYPHWEALALYNIKGDYAGNNGHRSDVFHFAPEKAQGSGHPTPKPLDLLIALVEFLPGQIICDPFMGTGTTLRAAKEIGKQAIGIEIHEPYCEIAAKRLSQEVFDFTTSETSTDDGKAGTSR